MTFIETIEIIKTNDNWVANFNEIRQYWIKKRNWTPYHATKKAWGEMVNRYNEYVEEYNEAPF